MLSIIRYLHFSGNNIFITSSNHALLQCITTIAVQNHLVKLHRQQTNPFNNNHLCFYHHWHCVCSNEVNENLLTLWSLLL